MHVGNFLVMCKTKVWQLTQEVYSFSLSLPIEVKEHGFGEMILTTKKQSLIDLHILNIFFIIAIKPTWSLWVLFLIWYWNKFVLFYWECLFLHSLRRLVCYFLFVWCFLSALVLEILALYKRVSEISFLFYF